jgi:hypothetical protein
MIHQPTCNAVARAAVLHPLLLLVAGVVSWPAEWDCVHAVLDCARSPEPGPSDRDAHAVEDYYEKLINGTSGSRGTTRPEGWIGFREANVIRYLDSDLLLFELKPDIRRTLLGQPFETNAFGMRGGPVEAEKPAGTFRIAVLGASMDMGWGVGYQDTYINRLQQWLNNTPGAGRSDRPRRYEILNFAVAAYSPLQRLETLRRKVLAFHPDLVIYSATTLDVRLMEIHLCDMLPKHVDLQYDFLREAIARTGIVAKDLRVDRAGKLLNNKRVKEKLQPYYWGIYDRTLGAIAAECRAAGVPLAMAIIPRVGSEDAPEARAVPVARLKALAAHHAITTFDLSDTFDRMDPATLEIAAWDFHPNAAGHGRLFEALSRALAADPTLAPLLLPSASPTPGEIGRAEEPDSPTERSTRGASISGDSG